MPNKIFVSLLDTIINPRRFEYSAEPKKTSTKANSTNYSEFSKSASAGVKAMTSPSIKTPVDTDITAKFKIVSDRIKAANSDAQTVLADVQHIQNLGQKIYSSFANKLAYGDVADIIEKGRTNGFETIICEDRTVIEFEHEERGTCDPEKIIVKEYKNGELSRKSTLVGKSVLTVEDFEKNQFRQRLFSNGNLYKYSHGVKSEDKEKISEEFYFDIGTGEVSRYSKDKVRNFDEEKVEIGESYKFADPAIIYEAGIENTEENYPLRTNTCYVFKGGELHSAMFGINKAKNLIRECYINRGKCMYDFYKNFQNLYDFNYKDIDKIHDTEGTSIEEKYGLICLDDNIHIPVSYVENYRVEDNITICDKNQQFRDGFSKIHL